MIRAIVDRVVGGEDDVDTQAPAADIDIDELFDALSTQRRRTILHKLATTEYPLTVGTLAEHVAAVENDCTVPEVTTQERKRVYVAIYQTHLNKLEDAGLCEWDEARDEIRATPATEVATAVLTEADQRVGGDA